MKKHMSANIIANSTKKLVRVQPPMYRSEEYMPYDYNCKHLSAYSGK